MSHINSTVLNLIEFYYIIVIRWFLFYENKQVYSKGITLLALNGIMNTFSFNTAYFNFPVCLRITRKSFPVMEKKVWLKISRNCIDFNSLNIRGLSTISVENGIGVWELNRPPVNSINLDVVKEINNVLTQADEDKLRGLIITSASSRIFSAGLDLRELYKPDPKRLRTMWQTLQEVAIKMLTCNFVTTVAINGHSSAGSVLLSILSDYRVAVDGQYTMGFNDSAVGIVPSVWVVKLMSHTLTSRKAELATIRSTLFSPKEALEVGMVDELAANKADAIARSKGFINSLDHIAPTVISKTRQISKDAPLSWLVANRQKDCDDFVNKILSTETQLILEKYFNKLNSKNTTKP